MKTLEQLALKPADVEAITAKAIADTIEEVARQQNVFAQIFRVNRDLVGPNKPREIQFPKKKTGIVVEWDVSAGAEVTATTFAYEAVTISVKKQGIQLRFTNEALEQALRDVIKDHIYEAGLEYTEEVDLAAQTVALDLKSQTLTISAGSVGTFANVPIIRITKVEGATIQTVEYDTGLVTLTGSVPAATITSVYSNRLKSTELWVSASKAGSLSPRDILRAQAKLLGEYRKADVMIINPIDLTTLFFDPNCKLVDASVYGGREPLLNAELGRLFGIRVVMSTGAPVGCAILVDVDRLGYDVRKREFTGTREEEPKTDSVHYYFWGERNFGVVDDKAIAAVINAAPEDYVYPAA